MDLTKERLVLMDGRVDLAWGRVDLVITNTDDQSVTVLLNNGDGTFADKVDYPMDGGPSSIVAVDLNGEANPTSSPRTRATW